MSLDVDLTCSCCKQTIFEWNITHNLGAMAKAANVYYELWRPDEIGIVMAFQLIKQLKGAVRVIRENKESLEKYNPENGWGDYDGLLKFVTEYFKACCRYPHAKIEVSR